METSMVAYDSEMVNWHFPELGTWCPVVYLLPQAPVLSGVLVTFPQAMWQGLLEHGSSSQFPSVMAVLEEQANIC